MPLREELEKHELERLSPYAAKSALSRGRKRPEEKCPLRTDFQRDRDRITHAKSFRRLMHKTQVFIAPEGDHYRTRLTHTLEVTQIARTIARALGLNEDLTEAIALGHDLGHTPFGHTGEDALDRILPGGFRHNEQSVRVVETLEKGGAGLNLCFEVIDGILCHRGGLKPLTLEGAAVQISDKIAYINHDTDDAVRSGIIRGSDLPAECREILGDTPHDRINTLIHSVIAESAGKPRVSLGAEQFAALYRLRDFLFENVYRSQIFERSKIKHMLEEIFAYYSRNPAELPEDYLKLAAREGDNARVICDYIAGMTDRFALNLFARIYMPSAWGV